MGWKTRRDLVAEQHVLQAAPGLEVGLHPLDANALPGLPHEARHHALGHDQGVVEHDRVADGHPPPAAEVRRRELGELPVELVGDTLADALEVVDPGPALLFPAPGREEQEEGIAAALVEGQQVGGAHLGALQLAHEAAHDRQHLLEGPRAVVVLDLRELGRVDQREGEVAGLTQLLRELAEPLVVRRDLGVQGGVPPTG